MSDVSGAVRAKQIAWNAAVLFFWLALIGNGAQWFWDLSRSPWHQVRIVVSVLFLVSALAWLVLRLTCRRAGTS